MGLLSLAFTTYLTVFAYEIQEGRTHPLEQSGDQFLFVAQGVRKGVDPGAKHGTPAQRGGLQVDHTTPTDGGGGCLGEVVALEDHAHHFGQLDDLAAHQTQLKKI